MSAEQYGITIIPQGLPQAKAYAYTAQVKQHLSWIERTKTGKILLNSIKWHKRPVEIAPYAATHGACNATASGQWNGSGDPLKGIINYSPDTWSKHGPCRNGGAAQNGGLWDEVLFHELVHVFRVVSGKMSNVALFTGLSHYTNNEEFYAILLQNIYVADKTNKIKTGYAGNHGFWPLAQEYTKPWGFFSESSQVFDLVDKFCQDHKGLSLRVANELADAAFNPIADYYADREKARTISRGAAAKDLDSLLRTMASWVI